MKSLKKQERRTKSNSSEELDDCSCEILLDTELSDVSDSDCSCSECMEANLNAFNQFINHKQQQTHLRNSQKRISRSQAKIHIGQKCSENSDGNIADKHCYRHHFSTGKKTAGNGRRNGFEKRTERDQTEFIGKFRRSGLEEEELNDFMIITQNRTRNYMNELKKKEYDRKVDKQKYKGKIAHHLEMLKYTAKLVRNHKSPQKGEQRQDQKSVDKVDPKNKSNYPHKHKWNHSQYDCACNGKQMHTNDECCAYPKPDRLKANLNTNMVEFDPIFMENRSAILEEAKEKRLQKRKPKDESCPYDQCPNHHMRTEKTKLAEIEKFINKQVRKYKKKKLKQREQVQNLQKIRSAKLRAIDIKSKQILGRSKKHQHDDDRTSFKLSIDNYATFSELREVNHARAADKKNSAKIKRMVRTGGGTLMDDVYKDAFEEQEMSNGVQETRKQSKSRSPNKNLPNEEPYGRIVRDAQIYSPKQIKETDKTFKKQKQEKNKQKNLTQLSREQKKRKQLQAQISKKKIEIMQEFQKRNTNVNKSAQQKSSKNKQVRLQLEKQMRQKTVKYGRQAPTDKRKDLYREVYRTSAGKSANQISAVGDPLIQEYFYHEGKNQISLAEMKEDRQIFHSNFNHLMQKQRLDI